MSTAEEQRLMARIAQLYYVDEGDDVLISPG